MHFGGRRNSDLVKRQERSLLAGREADSPTWVIVARESKRVVLLAFYEIMFVIVKALLLERGW